MDWELSFLEDAAISVTPVSGSLVGHESATVTVSVDTNRLGTGRYTNEIRFVNKYDAGVLSGEPTGSTSRRISVTVGANPGIVSVSPASGNWNTSPQWVDVSSPNAERIYCTVRTTTDGSTPENPPEPTTESHDIFNRNEDEFIAGDSGKFEIWAEPGEQKHLKVRFRGFGNGVYGPVSEVYSYTISSAQNTPGVVSVSPASGSWDTSPQWVDVSSPNAERIYCTVRTTTDGSTPENPPEPTIESHDIFNQNEDEYIGDSGKFEIWAEPGEVKNLKVRFRVYSNGVYGPTSEVYSYTINRTTQLDTYTNSLGMTFNLIPAGTFMMGSPEDELGRSDYFDETLHQVTLTQSYYMQTTEVTQGQWKAVMGSNPSYFSECGDNCPIETVSWDDAQEFITKMNQRGEGTYRLPTEAEWEYAARAGSTTAFANGGITDIGCGDPNLDAIGWYCGNANRTTHPVMQKQANAYGLSDMSGNVWEWCQDCHGNYPTGSVTDPTGSSSGSARVIRGGSWFSHAGRCRSADRSGSWPGYRDHDLGFRLASSPSQ